MPSQPHSITQSSCGLSADFVALSSAEIVSAEDCAGTFWAGDGSREPTLDDDCLVARHVVPFGSFPWHVWHRIASEILSEPYDLHDATQIDRLLQQRGLFPRDSASSPQWVALYQTDLSTLLERQHDQDSAARLISQLRVDVLDSTTHPFESDYYVDARGITAEQWEAVSVLIFEQAYTDQEGRPFDLIFDRPDLTTGTPSGRAFAALRELQNALSEYQPDPADSATFETYAAALAQVLADSPACTRFPFDRSTEAFAVLAAFVEQRHPAWLDELPACPSVGDLRPVPPAWTDEIEIVGLRDDPGARTRVSDPSEVPAAYGIYAERNDGSFAWLGTTSTLAEATGLKRKLETISAAVAQSTASG